jgi:hypothetical protein
MGRFPTVWPVVAATATVLAGAAASSPPAGPTQKWAGTLTFPPYAAGEALNLTIDTAASTAEIEWVFDKSGAGISCEAHVEPDLKVSILPNQDGSNTSTVHLTGTGKNPEYYSFAANLSADGRAMTGAIVGQAESRLELKLNAPQVPSTCRAAPTPAAPTPTPPSKAQLPVWPQPSSWVAGSGTQELDAKEFFFSYAAHHPTSGATPNTLVQAFHRYSALVTPHRPSATAAGAVGALRSLVVSVADPSEDPPQQGTNESYVLEVAGGGAAATLKAATLYGALRGLETFSQLVLFNFSTSTYSVAGVPLTVIDTPRFAHRGIMVDTSRHFLTKAMLYQLLDSMSYTKMNVLHWHAVDDQSFPMEVKSYPKLQVSKDQRLMRGLCDICANTPVSDFVVNCRGWARTLRGSDTRSWTPRMWSSTLGSEVSGLCWRLTPRPILSAGVEDTQVFAPRSTVVSALHSIPPPMRPSL